MKRGRDRIAGGVAALLAVAGLVVVNAPAVHAVDLVMPARAMLLRANDLVYDPVHAVIYASVPTSVGPTGNSIVTIDPATATVISSVYGGSDPTRMALSDDGSMLYVGLAGANAIRQYSLPGGMTFVRQFSLGSDPNNGPMFAEDIDVMPGSPTTIAVSRQFVNRSPRHAGVAIFDDGTPRSLTTQTSTGSNEIEFGSPTRIYGESTEGGGGIRLLDVTAAGVTEQAVKPIPFIGRLEFDGGRVYVSDGTIVVDPETGTVIKKLTLTPDFIPFAVDGAANRASFLFSSFPDPTQRLHVFDTVSFAEVATFTIAGMTGAPTAMVRWGNEGVAVATADGYVFIASPSTVTAPPPPVPAPVVPAYPFKVLDQGATDLVYDPADDLIYATTPNSLLEIDPSTATVIDAIPVEDPVTLAISDDSTMLYAGLRTSGSVAQFALPSLQPVRQFPIRNGPLDTSYPDDIAVMPGNPSSIAVTYAPNYGTAAIFDSGARRGGVTTFPLSGPARIAFAGPTELYGQEASSNGDLQTMSVSPTTLAFVGDSQQLLEEGNTSVQYANGVVYGGRQRTVDPVAGDVLGTMGDPFSRSVVDPVQHRNYVVKVNASFDQQLQVYDTTTYRLIETYALPSFSGAVIGLIPWGTTGLAFATDDGHIDILSKDFAPPPVDPPPVDPPPVDPPPVEPLGAFGEYTPLTPTRLLDTRIHPGALGAGGAMPVQITGEAGVPSSDVVAVVLNVTATGPQRDGYLTVWPADEPRPLISNVNYAAGETVPNLVTVAVSLEGAVAVFSSAQSDVVIDIEGYYSDSLGTPGGRFRATAPTRLVDTRTGFGGMGSAILPSSRRFLNVVGRAGLPTVGATAVVMNVTVTRPTASGFLTVYPHDSTTPLVSNLNFVAGQTVPNLVIVKVPPSGIIDMFNSAGATDVVVDVVGYFDEDRSDDSGRFVPFSPERVYDSRETTATHNARPLGPGESLTYADDLGASAYVFNVTATEPTTAGYLTAYPFPGPVPLASNVNFVPDQTVANLVYAPTGPDVGFFNSAGRTHIVVDLFGAFT